LDAIEVLGVELPKGKSHEDYLYLAPGEVKGGNAQKKTRTEVCKILLKEPVLQQLLQTW
jgi:hypothetical protein